MEQILPCRAPQGDTFYDDKLVPRPRRRPGDEARQDTRGIFLQELMTRHL